jgi:1-acyl-sn-glycerol-3-phosphate acyltransferase
MEAPLSALLSLTAGQIADRLPAFMAGYVVAEAKAEVAAGMERLQREVPERDWEQLHAGLQVLGDGYNSWPADPLAMRICAAYLGPLLPMERCSLSGLEHLEHALDRVADRGRVMLVGNHLSYGDTNVLGQLLGRAGRADLIGRLTAVAGPKVYSEPFRRLATAGMGSIKVEQSTRVATDQRTVSPREMARIARRCLDLAGEAMDGGGLVVLYPEGTRSRNRRMQPFLKATARWLTLPETVLVPSALWGSDGLWGDDGLMRPAECHVRFGPALDPEPIRAEGGRAAVLEAAHAALAELLPDDYRPAD